MTSVGFVRTAFLTCLVFHPLNGQALAQVPLQLSERQSQELVKRISLKVERFNNSLGRALAKPPLAKSDSALEFTEFLEDFTLLISQLTPRSTPREDITDVLRTASAIERLLLCEEVPSRVVVDWASLHADLDLLARAYGLKWSEAVVTKELVARLENEVRSFSDGLKVELPSVLIIRTAAANDLPALLQQFRQAVEAFHSAYPESDKAQHQISDLSSSTRTLGLYLRDKTLGLALQSDWRRLSAQVEELVRIYNLDFGDLKSPNRELFTGNK
jgi:hypothetical protein